MHQRQKRRVEAPVEGSAELSINGQFANDPMVDENNPASSDPMVDEKVVVFWTEETKARLRRTVMNSLYCNDGRIDWRFVRRFFYPKTHVQVEIMWKSILSTWEEEEEEKLLKLVEKHTHPNGVKWTSVAKDLGVVRTNDDCRVKYDQLMGEVQWKKEEEENLMKLVAEHTNSLGTIDWKNVVQAMPNRTNLNCRNKYSQLLGSLAWKKEEEQNLLNLVAEHTNSLGTIDWKSVVQAMPNRTNLNCHNKYSQLLGSVAWKKEEEENLMKLVANHTNSLGTIDWKSVVQAMPNRTNKNCRNKYSQLLGSVAWKKEEEENLMKLVANHTNSLGTIDWKSVVQAMPNRTNKNCHEKYRKLRFQDRVPWTQKENDQLLDLVHNTNDWIKISLQMKRSVTTCRTKYYELSEKEPPQKRRKKAVRAEIGVADFRKVLADHCSQREAAKIFNVSLKTLQTKFKKLKAELGIDRWPRKQKREAE